MRTLVFCCKFCLVKYIDIFLLQSGKIPSDGVSAMHHSEMAAVPSSRDVHLPKVTVDSMTKVHDFP